MTLLAGCGGSQDDLVCAAGQVLFLASVTGTGLPPPGVSLQELCEPLGAARAAYRPYPTTYRAVTLGRDTGLIVPLPHPLEP